MNLFEEQRLVDVCSYLRSGKTITASEISTHGEYPVFGENGCRGYTAHYNFSGECAIIGRQGAFCGNVRYFSGNAYMTEHAIIACANNKNNTRYLSYLLSTMNLGRLSGQSAQPGLSVKYLSNVKVLIPILTIQKKIVSILSLLDDKIEVNNKLNDNLQQQIAIIFKAWFVDFVPFDETMPSNWTVSTLGDVTEMGAGGDKPKETSQVKTPLYPYPIYSNGINNYGLYGYTNEPKIKSESVTVSARGTIGYVCLRHIPYVPIVRLVTLIPDTSVLSAKYLYLYLSQLHITGTGTTQQQLTVPDFRKTEIIIPDKATMDFFTETVTPLFEQIWVNEDENNKLAEVRDALLPKLMSGEIDVSNIQV